MPGTEVEANEGERKMSVCVCVSACACAYLRRRQINIQQRTGTYLLRNWMHLNEELENIHDFECYWGCCGKWIRHMRSKVLEEQHRQQ